MEQDRGSRYREACFQLNLAISYSLLGAYQRSQEVLSKAAQVIALAGDRDRQAGIQLLRGINSCGLGHLARAPLPAHPWPLGWRHRGLAVAGSLFLRGSACR